MQSRCVACGGQVETVPFGWCRPERSTAGQFALHYVRGQVPGATGNGEGEELSPGCYRFAVLQGSGKQAEAAVAAPHRA